MNEIKELVCCWDENHFKTGLFAFEFSVFIQLHICDLTLQVSDSLGAWSLRMIIVIVWFSLINLIRFFQVFSNTKFS